MQTTVSLFSRGKEKCFFAISKEKTRQGGFYKAAPLEPLLNCKVKPHRYQRGARILFVVPKLRYNAQKQAQPTASVSSYNQRDHAVERVSSAAGG